MNNFNNTEEFVKYVNKLRLEKTKDPVSRWYESQGTIHGKPYQIKGFKTWLQILRIDGIRHGGQMHDINVTGFKNELREAAEYAKNTTSK